MTTTDGRLARGERTRAAVLHRAADIASVEEPEILRKFVFPSDATTYQAFQTAAASTNGSRSSCASHSVVVMPVRLRQSLAM